MSNYNLSDNVNDSFNFKIADKAYTMRYPLTDEIEEIREITIEQQEAVENKDKEKNELLGDKLEARLYSFITPQGHETPVKEVLKKQNVKVMQNFNKMIRTELSIG